MAYEIPGQKITLISAADYTAGQYRATVVNSTGLGAVPALGAAVLGVVQNKPASGEAMEVMTSGITKMEASGVIAAGAPVASAADGRAVAPLTGNAIIGTAMEAAGAAGVYIPVHLEARGNA